MILFFVVFVVVLGTVLVYFTFPKVGYCFDTAFDETGERL
jgi:hypothetical protein